MNDRVLAAAAGQLLAAAIDGDDDTEARKQAAVAYSAPLVSAASLVSSRARYSVGWEAVGEADI